VSIAGVMHLTFRAGEVASLWLVFDTLELIRQVGILPSAGDLRWTLATNSGAIGFRSSVGACPDEMGRSAAD
jgi:hypothetical protein